MSNLQDTKCLSHHHGCDCREEVFNAIYRLGKDAFHLLSQPNMLVKERVELYKKMKPYFDNSTPTVREYDAGIEVTSMNTQSKAKVWCDKCGNKHTLGGLCLWWLKDE